MVQINEKCSVRRGMHKCIDIDVLSDTKTQMIVDKAYTIITNHIEAEILTKISLDGSPKETWDQVLKLYGSMSEDEDWRLKSELEAVITRTEGSLSNYIPTKTNLISNHIDKGGKVCSSARASMIIAG